MCISSASIEVLIARILDIATSGAVSGYRCNASDSFSRAGACKNSTAVNGSLDTLRKWGSDDAVSRIRSLCIADVKESEVRSERLTRVEQRARRRKTFPELGLTTMSNSERESVSALFKRSSKSEVLFVIKDVR